jgi:hypothetical protein
VKESKGDFTLTPNTTKQRRKAGRYLLGMMAADADEGAELLAMFALDPAECRMPEPDAS